ncbi:membrane protein insertion efficiency factor YidD [Candidatus Bipolaricaulota bacterium]|nr:membrane protein insertion efficiency factor YidD [Candidatus Bipolaricaulota bacterium]
MVRRFAILLITLYQRVISPAFPGSCRFHPSCSQYAKEAIIKYGLLRGVIISTRRILRCHPFNRGGCDPLP